ncbi:aminotransferase class I/II-fold pyridoxal phosphate-dependent enzyme [Xanthomonas sp. XNM01]|uniref:trans-sulfuration enzyme family protein n=1 Tax=Xanthomonas sp. XNM01 TaxID=2769289 RepID=UPI00178258F9|nr:aminotransferase class I/II-fold pyridoxal phosphate-dependent enzyme [Xanthomonas sp. XNM01]MBD9370324.1 aminotransferase class I/II-fold pyridoxal phosphate-dependent enzyme [Xanthomonas sp. XNM01]
MSRIETLAARAGSAPDPTSGALSPPIQLATTFEHTPDGQLPQGYLYQRYDNPTQHETEQVLAALDGAARALLFPTGMAAGATALQALPAGSHVLLCDDSYFSFRALAMQQFPRWGLSCTLVDFTDLAAVRAALRPETRLLWAETPSNPLLKVCDITALAAIAHDAGAQLLVDGTFAPPVLQLPLARGADIVLHSATKYLGGHGDVMGGVLAFREDGEHAAACHQLRLLAGATASPFAAWMIMRGVRTLPARMAWHCRNAQLVATFLESQARVEKVHFPGLESHPQHAIAAAQMRGFGGMLSFEVAGGAEAALAVAGRLRLFTNATSLGSTESLVEHRASIEGPASTTPKGLLRLSVGLEHVQDLIDDLEQALAEG